MRPESGAFFYYAFVCRSFKPFPLSDVKVFKSGNRYGFEFGISFQEIDYLFLVLRGSKGTGRINQISVFGNCFYGFVENVFLPFGAHFYVVFAPLFYGRFVFSKHSLARAGRVHNYNIKEFFKVLRDFFGCFV